MLWINFLHLYQPVNTDGHVIKEATEMSYLRLVRSLEEHPQIKFTFNIAGCLFLRWEELGYHDLIKRLNKLVSTGQLELTGSVAYHALLPLIPKEETIRQIKENEEILKKHFGKNFKPKGFFLPEMAYGANVAKIIKELGYEWLVLDEIAYNGHLNQVDFNKSYQDTNSGLKIIFRSREYSKCYVPELIIKKIEKPEEKNIITATDGELYGLRHVDQTAELEKLLKINSLKTQTISEFISKHNDLEAVDIKPCSWDSLESELKKNIPYALWFDKKNKIQQKLWQFANLVYQIIEKNQADKNYTWARWHLVRGFASCTFWWASAKDFRLFGPISWSPDEIERGLNELIRAVRALDDITTKKIKIKSEKIYIDIKKMVWNKHWNYYWKK